MNEAAQSHGQQQEEAVEHVGEFRLGSVVDIGPAADDLGDHRQAADQGADEVGDADRQQIAVQVGLAPLRIEQVDGLGAEQRFEAADQREHADPLDRFVDQFGIGEDREIGKRDGARQIRRHVNQELLADRVLVAEHE